MKEKTIYALGFFDGVHLGHQALLAASRELAAQAGVQPGVLTFDVHPEAMLVGKAPGLINSIEDRQRLLQHFGMEQILTLPFDRALMETPWQTFFSMLTEKYQAGGLVCGEDFRFGSRGEGTAQKLQEACRQRGIPCRVISQQIVDGIRVSSTHIRGLLENGQVKDAARFLGHRHLLSGTVVQGRQLGRTIGIPTANLALPEDVLCLRHGVYACTAWAEGCSYFAVTNVGIRPTVGGSHVTVESWLPEFSGDLYGKHLTLEFHEFLRSERKFPSLGDLQKEIQENALQARKIFEKS